MWNTTKMIVDSFVRAVYEVSFSILPVFLYVLTLICLGKAEGASALPGWAFASFSIYSLMMRDSIKAFRHRKEDETKRIAAAFISIAGLGVSGVLMTLSIVRSIQKTEMPSFFDAVVFVALFFGFIFSIFVKSISIQRDEHGRIV